MYAQISQQWPMQAKATSDLFILLQADRGRDESSDAKSIGYQEDILAVCKLHGYHGTPTVQNQLQALDREYQQLKEQGLSGKADYVQTLYIWLSKKTGKVLFSIIKSPDTSFCKSAQIFF